MTDPDQCEIRVAAKGRSASEELAGGGGRWSIAFRKFVSLPSVVGWVGPKITHKQNRSSDQRAQPAHKCEVSQRPAGGAACSASSPRSCCAASCVVTTCTCAFCNNVLATRTSQPPHPHSTYHATHVPHHPYSLSLPGTLQHTRHITLSFGDEFPSPQPLHRDQPSHALRSLHISPPPPNL